MTDQRAPYDPMPHGPAEVGVGPWPGDWPDGPQFDPELLAAGDRRNVTDRYRYWSMMSSRTLEAAVEISPRRLQSFSSVSTWTSESRR